LQQPDEISPQEEEIGVCTKQIEGLTALVHIHYKLCNPTPHGKVPFAARPLHAQHACVHIALAAAQQQQLNLRLNNLTCG